MFHEITAAEPKSDIGYIVDFIESESIYGGSVSRDAVRRIVSRM